ncbi:MAG: DHHA1 domain-containing protein [Minisyncoccota bacterium]
MERKQIVILYHKKCPDGFGAAYAAWKKYGDMAEYIPVGFGDSLLEGLEGREVFLLDFCYELPGEIGRLIKVTKRLVILDHHQSARERVEGVPEHIYDENRSGATIAWNFFHPDTSVPRLLQHLEDGDLYRYALPDTRDVYSYITAQPDNFAIWDKIAQALESPDSRARLLKKAAEATRYFEALADLSVEAAKKVRFEGYECYFATTLPSITMRSYVANQLYNKLPPLALVVTAHPDGFGVSIRTDGSVDAAQIAKKYNGGGHPGSAGFFIRNGTEMPWVEIDG